MLLPVARATRRDQLRVAVGNLVLAREDRHFAGARVLDVHDHRALDGGDGRRISSLIGLFGLSRFGRAGAVQAGHGDDRPSGGCACPRVQERATRDLAHGFLLCDGVPEGTVVSPSAAHTASHDERATRS